MYVGISSIFESKNVASELIASMLITMAVFGKNKLAYKLVRVWMYHKLAY